MLGGFSQGTVMTYALALGQGRPRPAGLIALSGFMPSVPGFELDLSAPLPPVAIGHGTYDEVIGVEWGRAARERLTAAGADILYRESPMGHTIDPGLPRRALEVAAAVMQFQLREYAIVDGGLDDFVAEWREHLLPLRLSMGFSVLGPWIDRKRAASSGSSASTATVVPRTTLTTCRARAAAARSRSGAAHRRVAAWSG